MNRFKVGDKVVCISPVGDSAKKYQVYVVVEALTHLVRVEGVSNKMLNERFILLSDYRKKKIDSLYE